VCLSHIKSVCAVDVIPRLWDNGVLLWHASTFHTHKVLRKHRVVTCVLWLHEGSGSGAKNRRAETVDEDLVKRLFRLQRNVCEDGKNNLCARQRV
jgi:hypothetical protein